MHAGSPSVASFPAAQPGCPVPPRSRRSGFSLVEVTLAIGIIAFAFVALLGLIPSGLSVFRESIDTANESWILQNLNSIIQTTKWQSVEDLSKWTFYYDEEGRLTDREGPGAAATTSGTGTQGEESPEERRIYAVKLIFGDPIRPGDGQGEQTSEGSYGKNTQRVIAVFAPYTKPAAMEAFKTLTTADEAANIKKNSGLKTRAFLVSRMEALRGDD